MDAVRETENEKTFEIYFGGTYTECWSEDYNLAIRYSSRRSVTARRVDGVWRAIGGDAELCAELESASCPAAMREYFNAAATVYAAARDCVERGLPLERLCECLPVQKGPFASAELMRLLMDDCGMKLEAALEICAECCEDCRMADADEKELLPYQPRTAHIVSVLRDVSSKQLTAVHDARSIRFRCPVGAVRSGEELRLSFRLASGKINSATLVLHGDDLDLEYAMESSGELYSAYIAPQSPAALWYCFHLDTDEGERWLCPDGSGYYGRLYSERRSGFRLTVFCRDFETPAWFRRSVMYQIFPDRFAFSDDGTASRGIEYHKSLGQTPELHKSLDEPVRYWPREFETSYSPDDFYGGTLRGIESKLPYLKELGVTCLYLNPIVEARSNHRYDSSDYLKVDPILGTNEDFTHLCVTARGMGIRIMLDGVYSHTGADSVYFNRYGAYPDTGACQGTQSPYYSWYDFRHFPDDYRCWWGFKDLPEVNERNGAWQDFVVSGEDSVVKTWLRRGASGWRLDVADELPDDTLALIRSAVKSIEPDAPVLGEVWEDAVIKESYGGRRNYALGYSLDSVMNYPFRAAALDFIHRRIDAFVLRDFLISQQMNYPAPMYYSLMNLLGTHDTDRIRTALATSTTIRGMSREDQLRLRFDDESLRLALRREKLCAVLQFAIPGVPSIYYGDEQGMCGVGDPFNRLPFREGETELHDLYAQLANMRSANPALSTGDAVFMAYNADILLVLRYVRGGVDHFGASAENGAFLAVINRGAAQCFDVECPEEYDFGRLSGVADEFSAKIIKV